MRVYWSFALGLVCSLGLTLALLPSTSAEPLRDVKPVGGGAKEAVTELDDYVRKEDKSFTWKLVKTRDVAGGKVYDIEMTSQTWHEMVWKHDLVVIVPKDAKPTATMFLWNQGGKPNAGNLLLAFDLAKKIKAPVCFLFGIPNQPLLGDRKEDALIAETFVRYLNTKDASWPLLFPMTKSLVRAMDALQAFAKKEWKTEVEKFVVAGASKRGWTSWLTAAADPRVKAVVPMVIDTLNMQKQMPHQVKSYGKYSEMIGDYVARKLAPPPQTPEGLKLWKMVDPWAYRDRYKMPKLILNGTNDPYWTQDALNLYWDDLPGPKWVSYVPNAGHNLAQKMADGSTDQQRASNVIAVFSRAHIFDKPVPKLTWKHTDVGGKARLSVESDVAPKVVRLWQTDATTLDFRKSVWKSSEVDSVKGKASVSAEVPDVGCRVFFAECEYEVDGLSFNLSTQMRILGTPQGKK